MKRLAVALSVAFSAVAFANSASAQGYPNRPIRVVVPYAPGGGVSVLAQLLGNKLSEIVKQPVVIENRGGAGGNLGADAVAKAAPDGYTVLLHTSALASAPALYRKLPFDVNKDFVPVTMVIATQFVIAGSPKHPAKNLRELIAAAKADPGKLNYASSGPGSSLHLFAELFKTAAGIDMLHVPYRGDAPMATALIAGDVQLAFMPQATGLANISNNLIRALGVTGTKRMTALPNVETALEQGVKGLEVGSWNAMFLPAGTPPDVVRALQAAVAKAMADPSVRDKMIAVGQEPVSNTPAEFAAQFKADIERFARIVEAAKVPKLD